MPTVLRLDAYRFFFFSNEGKEPAHIHVESAGKYAKFWFDPVVLANSVGYNHKELNRLQKIVIEHTATLKKAWYEYFNRR